MCCMHDLWHLTFFIVMETNKDKVPNLYWAFITLLTYRFVYHILQFDWTIFEGSCPFWLRIFHQEVFLFTTPTFLIWNPQHLTDLLMIIWRFTYLWMKGVFYYPFWPRLFHQKVWLCNCYSLGGNSSNLHAW